MCTSQSKYAAREFWTFRLLNSRFAYIIHCIHTLKFYASEPLTSLFPGSSPLRPNMSVLNVSNDGPRNIKLTLKVNGLWTKIIAQNFASQLLSKHFQNVKKKMEVIFFSFKGF